MHKHNTIGNKITISYLLLIILAAVAIGVLYNGINNMALLDTNSTKPNQKLKQINKILTHVYEAESFSRSYFLFRKDSLLNKYIQSNEKISDGIDSLKQICASNPEQVKNLNEITELLKKKKEIINTLLKINDPKEENILYDRVMDEVYFNTYGDLNPPSIIKQNRTTRRDSIFEIKDKPGFFNKVKKVFSPESAEKEKTLTRTVIAQEITYDTIVSNSPSNEQVMGTLQDALKNFKVRSELLKQRFVSQETGLLHSDRIILDRIRNIVSSLETEEILKTTELLSKSQGILEKANNSVIMLGALAFVLILVFLTIIFRDISRTKAHQAELQRAKKYSEELLRLKEQFVANMSHEIRTPLSAIIGFSEQLKKTVPNHDQEIFIQHIEQSSRHLHSLINNVLDLSKSNAGKLTLNKAPFKLNELIAETCQIFSNNAKSKGLTLICSCDPLSATPIRGDQLKVKQILINIIGNAIKFTQKGKIEVMVCVTQTEKILNAEIAIRDTGMGIAKDKIQYIFDEFSQADSNITRKFGGTGLGLSISKKMAELMNGSIQVKSLLNEGSTFTINIPFEICPFEDYNEKSAGALRVKMEGVKMLVVEDDETMRLLINHICNTFGMIVQFAHSGKDALVKIKRESFHLVLSDIQMPEISGIELVKAIKTINKKLPVIAFTAHSTVPDNALRAGFDAFLSKPFTEQEIILKIAETLGIQTENHPLSSKEAGELNEALKKGYSYSRLKEFTGTDEAAFQDIMTNFLLNTDADLRQIKEDLVKNNLQNCADKVHKLLPMFKQLQVNKLIEEMLMIERSKELDLKEDDLKLFIENFIEQAQKVIFRMKEDLSVPSSKS